MAEDEEPIAEGEDVEAPPKRKIPLLFVIAGGVVLLLIIAAVGLLLFGKKKPAPAGKHEPAASALEFGGHIDNAEENAQRAAALARAAADGGPPSVNAPATNAIH